MWERERERETMPLPWITKLCLSISLSVSLSSWLFSFCLKSVHLWLSLQAAIFYCSGQIKRPGHRERGLKNRSPASTHKPMGAWSNRLCTHKHIQRVFLGGWNGHCCNTATNSCSTQKHKILVGQNAACLKTWERTHQNTHTHTLLCTYSQRLVDYSHLHMHGFVTEPLGKLVGAQRNELFSRSLRVKIRRKYAC